MTFVDIVKAAKDTRDADDFISRVKAAVSEQLVSLDPSVEIEDTRYFNHSAIPDLVVKWPRENSSRSVYLRHSYQSVVDASDVEFLGRKEPVLVSLNTHEVAGGAVERLVSDSVGATRVLATDPAAFDVLSEATGEETPLTDLVRTNFVRGGRGLIDRERATSLVAVPELEEGEYRQAREEMIAQSFTEDAAARIRRTAQLIDLAMSGESSGEGPEESALVGGKLSTAELRHLVPWLLRQPRAVKNYAFWAQLGEYVSFADLENIRSDLADLDLTPLITANSRRWSAKRAYIGVSVPVVGDDTYEARSRYWSFRGASAIGIDIGEQRLSLAHNGQLLKGRGSTAVATWENIEEAVAGDRLSRIDLRGITRSVILTAERSPDIRADVQEVTSRLDDSYTVSELAIRTSAPDAEGSVDVEVDFDKAITSASSGASIADLSRVALQVMNYRSPVGTEALRDILGAADGDGTKD